MPSPTSQQELKKRIVALAGKAGAIRTGFARAGEVDSDGRDQYLRFIAEGRHGAMGYMANHLNIRADARLLMEDAQARSLIVCAFPYYSPEPEKQTDVRFATYARGSDYHIALRERLHLITDELGAAGFAWRVCIDSAPLRERYWAVKAGVGFIGVNSQLIVPGEGSYFFLATIITDAGLEPDEPCAGDCGRCGKCVKACPGRAIGADGSFDARRCLSYLTIEYRGELPKGVKLGRNVYGCDACQICCPHNRGAKPTEIEEFKPGNEVISLTMERIEAMTPSEFNTIFAGSAVKRARLKGLKRNNRAVASGSHPETNREGGEAGDREGIEEPPGDKPRGE
ncbi:MAG: tRNA epoxyqueuosine(34) reductase QueG [Bacteroidales bacterium]|nr:tRNA epoxyqueuosine(34) reductase QueG [Bacteroidales bacterium]